MADRKMPWMKFWVSDWMMDERLAQCSPSTRGIWMDLLCVMHASGRTGELSGTIDQLARVARCTPDEMLSALRELRQTVTAESRESHGVVTVINRRMSRDHKEREMANLRQQRKRGHAAVTPESPPCHDTEAEAEAEAEADITIASQSLDPPTSDQISVREASYTNSQNGQDNTNTDTDREYLVNYLMDQFSSGDRCLSITQITDLLKRGLTREHAFRVSSKWFQKVKAGGVESPVGLAFTMLKNEIQPQGGGRPAGPVGAVKTRDGG